MTVRDYDLIKQKLDEVIVMAERFPESVRELVYRSLVEALLREGNHEAGSSENDEQVIATRQEPSIADSKAIDAESARECSKYLEQYEGIRLNDMEFSAVVARFFTRDISPDKRVDFIGPELLMAAVRIADRPKRPANPATTLNNAKNLGEYLENMGKGVYGLSEKGIEMLDEKLDERSRWTAQKSLDEI